MIDWLIDRQTISLSIFTTLPETGDITIYRLHSIHSIIAPLLTHRLIDHLIIYFYHFTFILLHYLLHSILPTFYSTYILFYLHSIPPTFYSTYILFHLHSIPPTFYSTYIHPFSQYFLTILYAHLLLHFYRHYTTPSYSFSWGFRPPTTVNQIYHIPFNYFVFQYKDYLLC